MPVANRLSCRVGALALALLLAGCHKEPSRWEAAQKATEGKRTSVAEQAVDGSVFNRFFPKPGEGFDIVFKQEKSGFAQASLQQDGRELAVFSIFDTVSNPDSRSKYDATTDNIAGYPVVTDEARSLSALIKDRFQVQVRSTDPGFGESDRMEWLQKFDLTGISEIE
jgi:hypothetical protein